MTVSLMSLLGGRVNLSAGTGSEEPGEVTLTNNGDAAFDTVMAATELQEMSAEKLREFFVAHGAEVPAALKNGTSENVGEVLAQMIAANDGKKLPGNLVAALQEMLPQGVGVDASADQSTPLEVSQTQNDVKALLGDLPQRELTPAELSEIVTETGLPPVVVFAALQDTPAASPNLAHAMVDDMGAAEADANLPLPRGQLGAGEAARNPAEKVSAAGGSKELPADVNLHAARVSSQIAAVDFSAMTESKGDVLKRIVDVLRGEKAQAEFDWTAAAKPVAANGNEKAANAVSKLSANATAPTHANATAQANANANALANANPNAAIQQGAQAEHTTTNENAQNAQVNAQAAIAKAGQGSAKADVQMQVAANVTSDATKAAPQTATQATDTPQQQANFAATLEQSSALRGAGTADTMSAHLRHQTPAQQNTPADQVMVHINKAVADGSQKMQIQLKPHELGRVDVRIETDADGRSHVVVSADKRDTLEMLQRDARGLERALADAGLKTDSNSLSFNLRGGDGQQQAQQDTDKNSGNPVFDMNANYADIDEKLDESEMALTYDVGRAYRLNIDSGVDISV